VLGYKPLISKRIVCIASQLSKTKGLGLKTITQHFVKGLPLKMQTTDEDDSSATVSTPKIPETPSRLRVILEGVGWLSFSVVFNVLNTIVYAALYPKILEHITPDKKSYSTAFSIINTVTTLASAVALPTYGSLVDCLNWIKPSLIVTQYVGILATAALFFLGKLPSNGDWPKAHLYINELLYVVAMFFLRVAVMNNNALLPCFPKQYSLLCLVSLTSQPNHCIIIVE
jgi:hypothetical protein